MNAISSVPAVGLELARDQGRVVVQRRLEEQRGRDAQDRLVGLERHQDDPEDREQEEQDHQRQQRRRAGSGRAGCRAPSQAAPVAARSRRRSQCLMNWVESRLAISHSTISMAAERPTLKFLKKSR